MTFMKSWLISALLYDMQIIQAVIALVTDYIQDVKINLAEHYMTNISSVLIVLASFASRRPAYSG